MQPSHFTRDISKPIAIRRNKICLIEFFTYRFPWESAFTGVDVCPLSSVQNVMWQQHITSGIAFALKQQLFATHDLEWFHEKGCDIALNTAEFWADRLTFNETTNLYDIIGKNFCVVRHNKLLIDCMYIIFRCYGTR